MAPLLPLQIHFATTLAIPGAGFGLQQVVWTIADTTSADDLHRAWSVVIARHQALRLGFDLGARPPLQRVLAQLDHWAIDEIAVEGDEAVERFLAQDRELGLSPGQAPPWRMALLRHGPQDATLVWTFAQALLDGRSLGRVLEEVARELRQPGSLPPSDRDISGPGTGDSWLARAAERAGRDSSTAVAWWKDELAGLEQPATWPRDPLPRQGTAGRERLVLADEERAALLATAEALACTPGRLVELAWALVVGQQTAREEVVLGVAEEEATASTPPGQYLQPLPHRLRLPPDATVTALVARQEQLLQAAAAHAHAPLDQIARALGRPPGVPLFDAGLVLNATAPGQAAEALLGPAHRIILHERPDLPVLLAVTLGPRLEAVLHAQAQVVSEDTAVALLARFRQALQQLVRRPQATLGELDLLPAEERLQLLTVYNATQTPFPTGALLHDGVFAQAQAHPERLALISDPTVGGDGRLTYGELLEQVERLAGHLRTLGVEPEGLVVLRLGRSCAMVVAMLAALRAGCGYVPVDPTWPEERLRHILSSTRSRVLLTTAEHLPSWLQPGADPALAQGLTARPVLLDDHAEAIAAAVPAPPIRVAPGAIAYVIFTSGSTGTPKGVVIDHRGAVNTIVDCNTRFALRASDRAFGISAYTFDLSVYDVFGLLSVGGTLVLAPTGLASEPATWARLVRTHGVTVWNSVPALAGLLLDGHHPGDLASLRLVMMSGDWIPVDLPGRLRAVLPQADLWSLGGATEASIWSILHPITRVDPTWPSIPYGRPMANQTYFVLDPQLRPCPTLVEGDLFIGGIGLALGYWDDPVRTAAAFFIHPATGERLYRTGDRGRFLPSGEIEFLGRQDNQVKLRGFRIELGEIEAAARRHPGIVAAVAIKRCDAPGQERLVLYVVAEAAGGAAGFDKAALRRHCAAVLPPYMIPAAVVRLEALPLSANGKVDRKALPVPEDAASGLQKALAGDDAAWSASETAMAALWQEILGQKPDLPTRSFFDLGGNSLLAMRLVELVARRTGQRLALGTVYAAPSSVRSLAEALDKLVATPVAAAAETGTTSAGQAAICGASSRLGTGGEPATDQWLIPLKPTGNRPPFFFLGEYLDLGRHAAKDQPFYGLLLGAEVRITHPHLDFAGIARQALGEIRRVQPRGPYFLGGHCFGAVVAFEMAAQLRAEGESIALLAMLEAAAPPSIEPPTPPKSRALSYAWKRARAAGLGGLPGEVSRFFGGRLEIARMRRLGLTIPQVFRDFRPRRIDLPLEMVFCREGEHRADPAADERLAWGKWCAGMRTLETPGDHVTFCREPHAKAVADLLDQRLLQAQSQARGSRGSGIQALRS